MLTGILTRVARTLREDGARRVQDLFVISCFITFWTWITLRYTVDEIARLGDDLYERNVLPRMTADDRGRFVAIDVQSGVFEIDADQLTAAHRVLAHSPGAQIWFRRIGSDHVHRLGGRFRPFPPEADDRRPGK